MVSILLVILLLLFSKSHAAFLPSNSSIFPLSLDAEPPPLSPSPPSNSFQTEILRAIAVKERWDPSDGIRVSELDPTSLRVGGSQRYEFHVRIGRTILMCRFSDRAVVWRKPETGWRGFGPDLDLEGGFDDYPEPALRGLELPGPLDLRTAGADDEMSLSLPALNATHRGLKQILLGDGITIKVEGAQEVTIFHPHDIGLSLDRNSVRANQGSHHHWPFGLPSCAPLLSVRVAGSASIIAFKTRNPEAHVRTVFHTDDSIELLSGKCYSNGHFKQVTSWPSSFLSSELVLLDKALRTFLGNSVFQGRPVQLLKAKITSSNLVKFRMGVERDITENDNSWKTVAAWRTKPVVELIWFEIVARVEVGRGWKQMIVRKLTRPIMSVESSSWSNLMSNISFTEIPSIVLPPEALTLDVHW